MMTHEEVIEKAVELLKRAENADDNKVAKLLAISDRWIQISGIMVAATAKHSAAE